MNIIQLQGGDDYEYYSYFKEGHLERQPDVTSKTGMGSAEYPNSGKRM